jgi:uncharacterized protein YecE (DUF72 family)
MGDIRVGTSSWANRRLLASGWYPREVNTPAGRLAYYAERFDLVEVDTTYYAIPAVETTAVWTEHTPASFTFDVKAFSLFTGQPTPVSALPKDLVPAGGPSPVRRKDLAPAVWNRLWERFHEAIEPIAAAGKLGVVILQFPGWFARGDAARRRILATVRECGPAKVAVELRHRSWFEGEHALETLLFLQENEVSFSCVDMPPGHESWMPVVLAASADPAVVRFEGLEKQHEKQPDMTVDRFRHAYHDTQLRWWVARLRQLAEQGDVHVLLENCCEDRAPRDAERLIAMLSRDPRARATSAGSAPAR